MDGLFPSDEQLGLLTDLYELTMAAGYYVQGMARWPATFELWVRRLPGCRRYLVTAGLEQAVHYLTHLHFTAQEIAYLRAHPSFAHVPQSWFDYLRTLRFEGDVWAVPEGTVVFAGEPLVRIEAPLDVAQIVETYLLTTLSMQTMVASKAARIVWAAQGRGVVDFGSRRAHGPQAGLLAARASFIAGCSGTSNVEAARRLGIPAVGTQAHSWIMAHDDETEAFRRFGTVFPQACTLLIDTYDTLTGVRHALASGVPFQAVRLDSGDLLTLSRAVRCILDEAGRTDARIVASGDLNEYRIAELVRAGAPIDLFGVGTEMVTSRDDPTLGVVYKLVAIDTPHGHAGRFKLSPEKRTYPHAKQVYRQRDAQGQFLGDRIALATEPPPDTGNWQPLLVPVMRQGQVVYPWPDLHAVQRYCQHQLAELPEQYKHLQGDEVYPVEISTALQTSVPS
ncbi:MAG: nicotinate phosphoribosyltransferase [Gemmataceae bacterium]